jgi:hypothetical protein
MLKVKTKNNSQNFIFLFFNLPGPVGWEEVRIHGTNEYFGRPETGDDSFL